MKVRIKFAKTGPLQYVGHLDMLRSFQKVFRRADVDIAYSQGFNPHQITSFASPLGIGITSEGEYLDAEFNSIKSYREMIDDLNAATGSKYLRFLDFKELKEGEKKAMAAVAAASYQVTLRPGIDTSCFIKMGEALDSFLAQDEIRVVKKTKKSEKEIDIRPLIYKCEYDIISRHAEAYEIAEHVLDGADITDKEQVPTFTMMLSSGSENNLKPEAVLDELAKFSSVTLEPVMLEIHRLEMYKNKADTAFVPLID